MNLEKIHLQLFSTPDPKNLLLGAGPLYFDRWTNDGTPIGLRHLGNVEKFTFKTDIQSVKKQSSMSAARRTYAEAAKEVNATGSLTMDEFDPANLALGLFGEEGVINQAADNITNETYTVSPGSVIKLPHYKVGNVIITPTAATAAKVGTCSAFNVSTGTGHITSGGTYTGTTADTYYISITAANTAAGDIAGCKFKYRKSLTGVWSEEIAATGAAQDLAEGVQVTFDLGTSDKFAANDVYQIPVTPASGAYQLNKDYKVPTIEARGGLIIIPEASVIPKNTDVHISYNVPAGVFPKVSGATVGNIQGELLFLGDPSYGPCYNGEFWHVSLTPNGDIGLLSDDFATFGIDFTCLDDGANHPDDPLYRLVKLS